MDVRGSDLLFWFDVILEELIKIMETSTIGSVVTAEVSYRPMQYRRFYLLRVLLYVEYPSTLLWKKEAYWMLSSTQAG
jgi:hypothetical protein